MASIVHEQINGQTDSLCVCVCTIDFGFKILQFDSVFSSSQGYALLFIMQIEKYIKYIKDKD